MNALYQAERSPIQKAFAASAYQGYGTGKAFMHSKATQHASQLEQGAVVDLTNLSRVGFRGVQTAEFLAGLGFILPEVANYAVQQDDGSYVARLSATEYLLLGSLQDFGEKISQLEMQWKMDETANYLLPRQDSHAWFQLTGQHLAFVMAKLCAVDLSEEHFAIGQIAQTSVARINAIVINVSDAYTQKFNILCDRAAALYLWEVLLDAMQEFDGQAVGIEALL